MNQNILSRVETFIRTHPKYKNSQHLFKEKRQKFNQQKSSSRQERFLKCTTPCFKNPYNLFGRYQPNVTRNLAREEITRQTKYDMLYYQFFLVILINIINKYKI